jgi:hypothetical protein
MPLRRELFPALLTELAQGPYAHAFGGCHAYNGAECPNCRKPLIRHLRLDTNDPLIPLAMSSTSLPLLYCMRCALCWENFAYQVVANDAIQIVRAHLGERAWDEWYSELGDVFPERAARLHRPPPEFSELTDKLNADIELTEAEEARWWELLDRPRRYAIDAVNQVGGRTFFIQRNPEPLCPLCGRQTFFLASLRNDLHTGIKVTPDGLAAQLLFYICPPCFLISVEHRI